MLLALLLLCALIATTNLWQRILAISIVTAQGSKIEFQGREINVGLKYAYFDKDDESIELQKVMPGFLGFDYENFLTFRVTRPRDVEDLEEHCTMKPQSCKNSENGSYLVRSIPLKVKIGDKKNSYITFHNSVCNVFISYIGSDGGEMHRELVDNFFEESCS